MTERACAACGGALSDDGSCKSCMPAIAELREIRESAKRPKIAKQRYDKLLKDQGGLCAACGRPETMLDANGNKKNLVIYCYRDTAIIMGLICFTCNIIYELSNDSPRMLMRLASFLMRDEDDLTHIRLHDSTIT